MNKRKSFEKKVLGALIFLVLWAFTGCAEKSEPIVIWTNKSEVASYVELFNASQNNCKAIVVYKEDVISALPPSKDEKVPDVILGTNLKNDKTRKNFTSVGYLLHNPNVKKSAFYPNVLETGKQGNIQYLIPVSFNLPCVIFSRENASLLKNDYIISFDEIRDISASYNKKNKRGIYTSMGFAPRWDSDFLYTLTKMQGANFRSSDKSKSNIRWNTEKLDASVQYVKDWTTLVNESSSLEDDYAFKYLYMPKYKLISEKRCLFEFTTSDVFLSLPEEKCTDLDYRWIHNENKIPLEDDVVFVGIYKKAKNSIGAEQFILWLMNKNSQKAILERNKSMKLNTTTFGILGGFSSIQSVNEEVFVQYNPALRKNLPIADYLDTINVYPDNWDSIKENVIFPYLQEATDTTKDASQIIPLETRLNRWRKQNF